MKNNEKTFLIKEEQTAISFSKRTFSSTPLTLMYKLFRTKKVKLNDKYLRYYQHCLKIGDILTFEDDEFLLKAKSLVSSKLKTKSLPRPEVTFEIIYEDDNVLIVIKDHNVEMHNDNYPEKTLDNAVANYLFNSEWISSSDLFLVSSSHRLDKLTKGLVVYPKNPISKKILHNSFGNKDLIRKSYLAVCENSKNIKIPSSLNGFIHKDDSKKKMIFQFENNGNKNTKDCSMTIESIYNKGSFVLLEVELKTGRKHQIRSSLSYIGINIIGDKKYGSKIFVKDKIKLFAYKIEFINLPKSLSYLNGKYFEIKKIKEKIVSQIASSSENLLPKKFIKF